MNTRYHLAQSNIAYSVTPLNSPALDDFHRTSEEVDRLARQTRGFVWRIEVLNTDPDDSWILNLSLWESLQALSDFTYGGLHGAAMRRRREWFKPYRVAQSVLWWQPAGTLLTRDEGFARLDMLRAKGPTPDAFTFRRHYPAPGR